MKEMKKKRCRLRGRESAIGVAENGAEAEDACVVMISLAFFCMIWDMHELSQGWHF